MRLRIFLFLMLLAVAGCATPTISSAVPTTTPVSYERVLPAGTIQVLDNPTTVTATDATLHIGPQDLVMGMLVGDQARAYPLGLMRRYGITNDVLGNQPIAVTFCNACNTGLAFSRQVAEQVLTFEVSGLLFNGAMVMTDRETESNWSQIMLKALEGDMTGTPLELLASNQMTWAEWQTTHPNTTLVLDPRAPERSPSSWAIPVLPSGNEINLDSMYGYVVGISTTDDVSAYAIDAIERDGLVLTDEAPLPLLLVALGEKGAVAVWDRRVSDQTLTFFREDNQLIDHETQSVWDPQTGQSLSGPLAGEQLTSVSGWVTDWRGWFDLYPETSLYQ